VIVGCLLFALYAMKNLFDIVKNMDRSIDKLKRVTNLLQDRLSGLEIISLVDQEKAQKNPTKNE
jgi:ABC-type transport system involved in cytochrome bd biosynthesis fused ATPase/permease subunit